MAKFLTNYQVSAGVNVNIESETVEDVLDIIAKLSKGMLKLVADRTAPAVDLARPALALVTESNAYAKAPDPTPEPVVEAEAPVKRKYTRRVDQKKGAVTEAPAQVAVAASEPAPDPAVTAPAATAQATPAQTVGAGRNMALQDVAAAVRKLAHAIDIPAATNVVNSFKQANGEAASRVDQLQPADYPAVLEKIDKLLAKAEAKAAK